MLFPRNALPLSDKSAHGPFIRAIRTGCFLLVICLGSAAHAASQFSGQYVVAGTPLQKCGEAVLKAYSFFTVGKSALYRPDCSQRWQVDEDEIRYIEFRYERDIPAEAFSESAEVILERNVNLNPEQKSRLQQFHSAYKPVENGDVYAISYSPDAGLQLFLNDDRLGELSDPGLARQYFSIWLGEQPFDSGVKRKLLGQ